MDSFQRFHGSKQWHDWMNEYKGWTPGAIIRSRVSGDAMGVAAASRERSGSSPKQNPRVHHHRHHESSHGSDNKGSGSDERRGSNRPQSQQRNRNDTNTPPTPPSHQFHAHAHGVSDPPPPTDDIVTVNPHNPANPAVALPSGPVRRDSAIIRVKPLSTPIPSSS
jgi:hypothetical protein